MWSCFSGPESVQALLLEIKLSRGEGWDPINIFIHRGTPHFCSFLKPGPGFPRTYVAVFFYVQLVKVRGDCLFS